MTQITKNRYLSGAETIAESLLARVETDASGPFWRTLGWVDLGRAEMREQTSYYCGTAGICDFLLQLHGLNGAPLIPGAVRAVLLRAASGVLEREPTPDAGLASDFSLIPPMVRLAMLTNDADMMATAHAVAAHRMKLGVAPFAELLYGAAGQLLILACLHRRAGTTATATWIQQIVDHLTTTAMPGPRGLYWDLGARGPLCGLSHGTAGVALALHEAAALMSQPDLGLFVDGAFAYESYLQQHFGYLPDLRVPEGEASIPSATPGEHISWCQGAPGVGAASLWMLRAGARHNEDHVTRAAERTFAAESRRRPHSGSGFHPCHGACGNRDFLLDAGRELGQSQWVNAAYELGDEILDMLRSNQPFPAGYPHWDQADGSLFLGMSGVGHYLLRLAAPDAIHSLLTPTFPLSPQPAVTAPAPPAPSGLEVRRRLLAVTHPKTVHHLAAAGITGPFFTHEEDCAGQADPVPAFERAVTSLSGDQKALDESRAMADFAFERRLHELRHIQPPEAVIALADVTPSLEAADIRPISLNPFVRLLFSSTPAETAPTALLIPQPDRKVKFELQPLAAAVIDGLAESQLVEELLCRLARDFELDPDQLRPPFLNQVHELLKTGILRHV